MEPLENRYQFTPRALQVIALATKEAVARGHNFVGTEHLILGIVALGEGTYAAQLLKALGVEVAQVKTETERLVGKSSNEKPLERIPLTPRSKKVISLAKKERETHNHGLVGTEHILIGMLREGDGVAARVLRALNVDLETARREMLKTHPAETSTNEAAEKPDLAELLATAEEMLAKPPPKLRVTLRVLAALCAVNHIESDDEREGLFLRVLIGLRDKPKA